MPTTRALVQQNCNIMQRSRLWLGIYLSIIKEAMDLRESKKGCMGGGLEEGKTREK